jgi:large repetitive protein
MTMTYKRTTGRKCRFETLETRRVLAGNVFATVAGGVMKIEGDRLDNRITITAGPNPFEFIVTGLTTGGAPTQVNGVANAAVTLRFVTKGLKADLGNGNNTLTVNGITITGKVTLETGSGIDAVTVNNVLFKKDLKIETGKNEDDITIANSTIRGTAKINSGKGSDSVLIVTSQLGALNAKLGTGNDNINILSTTTVKKTTIAGGPGIDLLFNVGASNFFANYSKSSIGG